MEINNFFSNLKNKIISLKNKLSNYCKENKVRAVIFVCCFLLILLLILLITAITKNNKKDSKIEKQKIVFTQDLLIPDELSKEYDYEISRDKKENWTSEETDKWFTIPTEDQIEQLTKENDKMINDLIGAAP